MASEGWGMGGWGLNGAVEMEGFGDWGGRSAKLLGEDDLWKFGFVVRSCVLAVGSCMLWLFVDGVGEEGTAMEWSEG